MTIATNQRIPPCHGSAIFLAFNGVIMQCLLSWVLGARSVPNTFALVCFRHRTMPNYLLALGLWHPFEAQGFTSHAPTIRSQQANIAPHHLFFHSTRPARIGRFHAWLHHCRARYLMSWNWRGHGRNFADHHSFNQGHSRTLQTHPHGNHVTNPAAHEAGACAVVSGQDQRDPLSTSATPSASREAISRRKIWRTNTEIDTTRGQVINQRAGLKYLTRFSKLL